MLFSKRAFLLFTLPVVFLACQSTKIDIKDDMTPAEFFQRAQEAVIERNDYDTALVYYSEFLERFPNDLQNSVVAEYEIGLIYKKQSRITDSRKMFETVLARYKEGNPELLPKWPQVLAEKLLKEIEEKPL